MSQFPPEHVLHGERRPAVAAGVRIGAVLLLSGLLVLIAGDASAYWLCVPAALLIGSVAPTVAGTVAGAAAAVAVAEGALVWRHVNPLPSAALAVLVPAASVAVLHSSRRRLERQRDRLRDVALTDPLTGVANRRMLLGRAEYEIARHLREQRSFALVMLDLDGFKRLNDRFGHAAGDEILCDIAVALAGALRAQDTVARLGGDEFCVLAPETDGAGIGPLAVRIETAIEGATAGVDALGATVGIALFPHDGRTVTELMEAADHRLLGGKRARYSRSVRRRAAA